MSPSFAILIDGGFVKRRIRPFNAAALQAFVGTLKSAPELVNMRLHRIYFYDAQPMEGVIRRPLAGGDLDLGASPTASRNKMLHSTLIREPFFALRYGELAHNGWRLKSRVMNSSAASATITAADLEPNIQQKGVDMRIGLDIASLTLKKLVDVIVLVTGDSDFVPAMKFARREGAQLFLVPLGHGIKQSMHEHADVVLSMNFPEALYSRQVIAPG
jgi:uncharacterized LabA/DUF88 family protein